MTKPRFVVDPVPDLAGLDPQEQQQAFMAWAQRQFDRIHDWWPKDSEDRLIALEELNTKIKGFWPIVDYSIVQFDGTATIFHDPDISCAQAVGYEVASGAYATAVYDILISGGALVAASSLSASGYKATTVRSTSSGTEIESVLDCSRFGSLLFKAPSSSTVDRVVISQWLCGATVPRYFHFYTWPGMGYLGSKSMSLFNVIPQTETDSYVIATGDFSSSDIRIIDKTSFSFSSVSLPSGWITLSAGSAAQVSTTTALVSMKNSSSGLFGLALYTQGAGFSTPVIIDLPGQTITSIAGRPIVVGSYVYWPVQTTEASPGRANILKTDSSGNKVESILAYDGAADTFPGGSHSILTYSENTNSLYYVGSAASIWKYSLTTGNYSQCTPAYPDGWTITEGRSSAIAYNNKYVWTAVRRYDSTKWGLEKIKVED